MSTDTRHQLANGRKNKVYKDLETYLSDYEQGAFGAMLEVFPGIGEEGCFFHLCNRLDYQVKELGLMPKYRRDAAFRLPGQQTPWRRSTTHLILRVKLLV